MFAVTADRALSVRLPASQSTEMEFNVSVDDKTGIGDT